MFPAFGLYSHIQANRRRSIALLLGLFFLVYAVVFAGALALRGMGEGQFDTLAVNLRGAYGDMLYAAPVATIAVLAWIFIAYFGHQKLIDAVTGAHEISRQDDPRLYRMLENLCISRGMTTPKLKIMETDALNAFASGLDEKQYTVTLTRGLVERLEDDEIEAVIAHELTHIRNEDVRMMVIAVIIAGVVSFTGELLFRSLRYGGRMRLLTGGVGRGGGRGGGRAGGGAAIALLVAAVIVLVAWLLSLVIRFALSRSREYLADAGAVELTKRPDAMISALLKISGRAEMRKTPSSIMEMCIENPRTGFTALLATHPSIEDRVAALERHAGGRRPPPEKLTLRPSAAELLAQEKAAQERTAQEKAGDGAQQGGRNTPPFPPTPWSGLPGMPGSGSGSGGESGGNGTPTPWSGNSPWGKN
ncbi:MAG: M48 family metallopeptidase [Salinarimonas sp.]